MSLLTRKQLAESIGVSRQGLTAFVKRGMPELRIGPKTIRYDWEAVKRWFEEESKKYQPATTEENHTDAE